MTTYEIISLTIAFLSLLVAIFALRKSKGVENKIKNWKVNNSASAIGFKDCTNLFDCKSDISQ